LLKLEVTSDEHEDKIFVRGHFTDFEKLLFAQDEIKQLKKNNSELSVEIGKAQSYITELEDTIRQLNANPRSAEEKKELRALDYNQELLRLNKQLMEQNRKLKKTNSELIFKLCQNENR